MSKPKFCPLIKDNCKESDCALYISEECAFCDVVKAVSEVKDEVAKLNTILKNKG